MRVAIKEIIRSLKETGNVTKTARSLGIARSTVYRWKKRSARIYGYKTFLVWRGLKRKSTRPQKLYFSLSHNLKTEILRLKKERHFGPKKIKRHLGSKVSHMTIHRYLEGQNLVVKQPNFRRPLFQNGFAMRPANTTSLGYLQMDTKHVTPELGGLPFTVYEYAAIDIFSRYKLAVLLPDISDESASLALEYFLKWFPFQASYIQTDNGLEYQQSFQKACEKHKIYHYFIHKNSPNENAVIERSFKTDQEEFYFWLEKAPEHIGELNQ
jgi:IS30 family transposase